MLILAIILFIISILILIYAFYSLKHTHEINKLIDVKNKELENNNNILKEHWKELDKNISLKQNDINALDNSLKDKQKQLENIQNNISQVSENQQNLSQKAFENYCKILENQYKEQEEEYDRYKDALETSYSNLQLKLMREADEIREELDKIKATRTAAIQAQTREKEIEEKLSFYCLTISENELKDIGVLEAVAPKLSKPRVLWMLIWQTFFRTPMTNLCNNVIGTITKSGIYKITNIKTKECYIGQAVDLASRWKDHAKCGLHIDTPAGNQLYKAMQEYGIWNFSWEILEEVPPAQLNEKEKYYIDLYDAKNFGYNSTKGNSTKGEK